MHTLITMMKRDFANTDVVEEYAKLTPNVKLLVDKLLSLKYPYDLGDNHHFTLIAFSKYIVSTDSAYLCRGFRRSSPPILFAGDRPIGKVFDLKSLLKLLDLQLAVEETEDPERIETQGSKGNYLPTEWVCQDKLEEFLTYAKTLGYEG